MSSQVGKRGRNNSLNNTNRSVKQQRANLANITINQNNKSFAQKIIGYPAYKEKLKNLATQLSIQIIDTALNKVNKKTLHKIHKALTTLKKNRNKLDDIVEVIKEIQREHDLFINNLQHQPGIRALPKPNNISHKIKLFSDFLKETFVIQKDILVDLENRKKEYLNNISQAENIKERIIKDNYKHAAELITSARKNAKTVMNTKQHKQIINEYMKQNPHLSSLQQSPQGSYSPTHHGHQVLSPLPVQYTPLGYRGGKKSPKKISKKKSTTARKKKISTPKKHKGPRGGIYIIRKGRKIYQ